MPSCDCRSHEWGEPPHSQHPPEWTSGVTSEEAAQTKCVLPALSSIPDPAHAPCMPPVITRSSSHKQPTTCIPLSNRVTLSLHWEWWLEVTFLAATSWNWLQTPVLNEIQFLRHTRETLNYSNCQNFLIIYTPDRCYGYSKNSNHPLQSSKEQW